MEYQEYIKSELLVLVPVLYIIGLGLKKSKMKDKWIPLVLGIIGIALSAVWVAATSSITNIQESCHSPIYRRQPGHPGCRCQRLHESALCAGS